MKENILNKLLVVCCLLAVMSCHARKKVIATHVPAPPPAVNNVESRLNLIRTQQTMFNTFSAKAHAKLDIDGNSNDVTLTIRINRDKEIWVSVTYLIGIEVARAVITPDSIKVMNKVQSVYLKKPFSYIYAYTNRQVDYKMVQALLIGNAVPSLLNDNVKLQTTDSNVTLNGNLQEMLYKLVVGPDMKVTQTNMSSPAAGLSLQVSNSAFMQSGNNKYPSQIDIASVAKDKKVQINLKYFKADFNQPQEYPFNIPDSYSQVN